MKWSQQRSRNYVAAKARKRMAGAEWSEPLGKCRVPRKTRARFTIQIRDNQIGDSLTMNLHASPWPNLWLCEHGQFSSAKIGRAVTLILGGGQ